MNTVLRTLGGALGGQLSATFIAANTRHGTPTVTGFTATFVMASLFLLVSLLASLLVPRRRELAPPPFPDGAGEPVIVERRPASDAAA